MILADFIQHLQDNNCSINPIEGKNLTGIGLKIKNNNNQLIYYLQLYGGAVNVSANTIKECCSKIGAPMP